MHGAAGEILENPGLAERLMEVLRTPAPADGRKPRRQSMNWADFYLVCFLVGFGLSALALVAGSAHLHLPHLAFPSRLAHAARPCGAAAAQRSELPWFNFGTMAAFLAWFGGAGYLLERYYARLVRRWRWGWRRSAAWAPRRWCSGSWPRC